MGVHTLHFKKNSTKNKWRIVIVFTYKMTSGYHLLNSLCQMLTKIPRKRRRTKVGEKNPNNNENWVEQTIQSKNLGVIANKYKANGGGLRKNIYIGSPKSKYKLVSGNRSWEKWGSKISSSSLSPSGQRFCV